MNDMLGKTENRILEIIANIQGNSSFFTSGTTDFVIPGLKIKGFGELAFPFSPEQARSLINQAKKAPFGKGSKTITDVKVRSAWEIDGSQISFANKSWEKKIKVIEKEIKIGLGIEENEIELSLYKLLIYEKGDFFLPHLDSEKEKGMFGTLVVGLPSEHAGGNLVVRFNGQEESDCFAETASNYQIPYAAFYTDCEHELTPVTSGYRICLTYNLIQSSKSSSISSPQYNEHIDTLSKALKKWSKKPHMLPGVFMLDHQYTPANLSLDKLKRHDSPRAKAMILAAEKADCHASLCLLTHYQMGDLEGVDYYDNYGYNRYGNDDDDDGSGGTMGDVHEQYCRLTETETVGDQPSLGELDVEEEGILRFVAPYEDEPIEKYEEGYTGNAGMTLEYWYHYGAVIFWPKKSHIALLIERDNFVKLEWLSYYLDKWNEEVCQMAKKIVQSIVVEEDKYRYYKRREENGFSSYAQTLAKIGKGALLKTCGKTLSLVFEQIDVDSWLLLLKEFKHKKVFKIVDKAISEDNLNSLDHLLSLLVKFTETKFFMSSPFFINALDQLPNYLEKTKINEQKDFYQSVNKERSALIQSIISKILHLSEYKEKDEMWTQECLDHITNKVNRAYINDILLPIVRPIEKGKLYNDLRNFCIADLKKRTASVPQPPPNWTRKLPESSGNQDWSLLKYFLQSPTQMEFLYTKNAGERSRMESLIRNVEIDLKMETIKKSRPYTLKITKTQYAYEKDLNHYKQDLKILKGLDV